MKTGIGSDMAMGYTLYVSISQQGMMFAFITLQRHTTESTYQINSWAPDKYLIVEVSKSLHCSQSIFL